MHKLWFIILMLAALAVAPMAIAQTKAPASPTPKQHKAQPTGEDEDEDEEEAQGAPTSSNVPPTAAVITIKGLCDAPKAAAAAAPKAECKTVITRAEFENLANTLQPGMTPQVRKQLANAYPRILVLSKEAQKRGLDKDPHYVESLKFAKMQLLNQELNRQLQAEAAKVPQKDIEDYYQKNSAAFEQFSLQRVFVPKSKQLEAPKEGANEDFKAKQKEAEDAMTKVAEDLRSRAAAGEDFDKLAKEAYDDAGIKASPPPTSMPKVRRMNLPPAQASVFDLKPGDVSPVINDPSGHYIYKLQSRTTPPLDEVKDEIRGTLQSQRMRDLSQKVTESVTTDLNEAYFSGTPAGPSGAATRTKPAEDDEKPTAKPSQK